jgi:hypothetical protein
MIPDGAGDKGNLKCLCGCETSTINHLGALAGDGIRMGGVASHSSSGKKKLIKVESSHII